MPDFTLNTYKSLLNTLNNQNYSFLTFESFISGNSFAQRTTPNAPRIILRHDVDKLPQNSLQFAQIQHELGITGTYYFRVVPESYDERIMQQIAELGHEIGYHYEDVSLAAKKQFRSLGVDELSKEDLIDLAYQSFCQNLEKLRKNFDIKTICMHGSPMSKYDNKMIWEKYDYHDLEIIAEPYFDLDFTEFGYYTDTGRRWDGEKVSVRDKMNDKRKMKNEKRGIDLRFRHTWDIIDAAKNGRLPQSIMFTFHPQRWTNMWMPWIKELIWQNTKNVIKRIIVYKQH